MNGLDAMKVRANYLGYDSADTRLVSGKLRSFHSALKNSYQAEWITLNKGTEKEARWRCLINPSRLTEQFDKKVLSIDYDSGIREGDVFYWDRTGRYWMVSLQQHTEEAYFRGSIARADYELDVNGRKYHAFINMPDVSTTEWKVKHNIAWNNLNYKLAISVKKDSVTMEYFTRHRIIKIKNSYPEVDAEGNETGVEIEEEHRWKVVATDKFDQERIITVYLEEYYDNEMEDKMQQIEEDVVDEETLEPYIEGNNICYPYDTGLTYSIVNSSEGSFSVDSNKVKILSADDKTCKLEILGGKAFVFNLIYTVNETTIKKEIHVEPF